MVGRILFALMLSAAANSSAQEDYIQPGLLEASLTYSPSVMLNHDQNNFYVSGFAEYFFEKNFSFRGDSYLLVNTNDYHTSLLLSGVKSYFGIAYHMSKGNWDGYVGFQPGITVMNRKLLDTRPEASAALRIGTTYYVWKYFHFFANLTYTRSKLNMLDIGTFNTDELTFSAGLGFQIQTKKKD